MSDYVWWVRKTKNSAQWQGSQKREAFIVTGYGADETYLDDWALPVIRAIWAGDVVADEQLPARLAPYRNVPEKGKLDKQGKRLSPFFVTEDKSFATQATLDIFSNFETGNAVFHPVKFYEYNNEKFDEVQLGNSEPHMFEPGELIDEPASLIMPMNIKDSFSHDHSPEVVEKLIEAPAVWARPGAEYNMPDDIVALSKDALVGPDIWIEHKFRETFFLSERLVNSLKEAGIADHFDLVRARIV